MKKLLQAFENILNAEAEHIQSLETSDPRGELDTVRSAVAKLCKLLQRDGYQYKNNRIIPVPSTASLHLLKEAAVVFNAEYLSDQVRRLEQSIDTDPGMRIGAAKELAKTCCYTILSERGKPATDKPNLLPLVRRVLEELKLVPDGIADAQKGAKSIKSLLGNLATITQELGGTAKSVRDRTRQGRQNDRTFRSSRPPRGGAATTLAVFLFDTHQQRAGVS